jgi:glyoxylase-like metal-dependent hydrolase (beta-lactamase superfamily II)
MEIELIDVSPGDITRDTASYLIITDRYNVLVETGPTSSLGKLLDGLEELGLSIRDIDMVFVTHIHLDHAGASGHLVARNRDLMVHVHPRGYPHLNDVSKLWLSSKEVLGDLARVYGPPKSISRRNLVRAMDGGEVDLGEDSIITIFTPGHASHHMVFYMPENRYLFSGDALGLYHMGVLVPVTPKPHNPVKAIESIGRLMDLDIDTVYFTHFGSYTPGDEIVGRARDKWVSWMNLFNGFYRDGYDVDTSYKRLLELDDDARLMDKYYKDRGFGGDELRGSVEGMLSYFSWLEGG